ncbi:MAG: DMT family transporter [Deltaproteobacteria bacterium]|nr:DMT family transporter [Deltaproteobacteria bacterium]
MSPIEFSKPRSSLFDVVLGACVSGPRSSRTGIVLVAAAAALWGCWSLCFKSAERLSTTVLSATTETAVVFIVMLLSMLPLALLTRRRQERAGSMAARPASAWALLMLLGCTDAANGLAFFQAMQTTSVAIAVLTHYLTPLIVALLAPLVLKEKMRGSTLIALAIALSGLVLLLRPWTDVSSKDIAGASLGALSAIFYASNVFLGKRLFSSFNSFEVAAWPKLSSVTILVAAALLQGDAVVETAPLLVLLAGGFLCGSVPTVLFYAGLQRIAASQASVLTLVEPLVAVVVGVVVWQEALHPLGIVGGLCVLGGAVIIARAQAA